MMTFEELQTETDFLTVKEHSLTVSQNDSTAVPPLKAPKAPIFIFMPHFEHNNYDIFVPEGKNKVLIFKKILKS